MRHSSNILTSSVYAKPMARVLQMMLDAITSTLKVFADWLQTLPARLNTLPLVWTDKMLWITLGLIIIFILLLSILLVRLIKRPRHYGRPELLISHGDITPISDDGHRQLITLSISNLNPYPIQLLEFSIKTNIMMHAMMIDITDVASPHNTITLEAELEGLEGETGVIELYAYTAATNRQIYRLKANLNWEPWNNRYKVETTGQTLNMSRTLASANVSRQRKAAWLEQQSKQTKQTDRKFELPNDF